MRAFGRETNFVPKRIPNLLPSGFQGVYLASWGALIRPVSHNRDIRPKGQRSTRVNKRMLSQCWYMINIDISDQYLHSQAPGDRLYTLLCNKGLSSEDEEAILTDARGIWKTGKKGDWASGSS